MIEDFQLTDHFNFHELTQTSNAGLLEENREKAREYLPSLKALAMMLELVRGGTGPLKINSGFRCPALNGATVGSSNKSQHMLGEAADFIAAKSEPTESNIDGLFQAVLTALIERAIPFGQLIKEQAQRDYGVVRWIHLSLGVPFREPLRCGEVLKMVDGKYTLLKRIYISR